MKDLGAANYILGMEIKRDRTKEEALIKTEEVCRDNIVEV